MADKIKNFLRGTTKRFTGICTINFAVQDITSDTVTIRFKKQKSDSDDDAALTKSADVLTEGSSGIAIFDLTPIETDIPVGNYYVEIFWITSGGDKYVIYDDTITVSEKVSDV